MITQLVSHIYGELTNKSVEDVRANICQCISSAFESSCVNVENPENLTPKQASDSIRCKMFGPNRYISVNSKNIEYGETLHFVNFGLPLSQTVQEKLEKGFVKDFLIQLTVYRLGQYSYYSAEITPLVEIAE